MTASGRGCASDRDLLDFFTIQVAPDGRVAIAYAQDDGDQTSTMFVLQDGGPLSR